MKWNEKWINLKMAPQCTLAASAVKTRLRRRHLLSVFITRIQVNASADEPRTWLFICFWIRSALKAE